LVSWKTSLDGQYPLYARSRAPVCFSAFSLGWVSDGLRGPQLVDQLLKLRLR